MTSGAPERLSLTEFSLQSTSFAHVDAARRLFEDFATSLVYSTSASGLLGGVEGLPASTHLLPARCSSPMEATIALGRVALPARATTHRRAQTPLRRSGGVRMEARRSIDRSGARRGPHGGYARVRLDTLLLTQAALRLGTERLWLSRDIDAYRYNAIAAVRVFEVKL